MAVQGEERNHFSLNLRVGLNLRAEFETSADALTTGDSGAATGTQVDREYEDGYVRVDVSGNAGGQTWYWGYDETSQVSGGGVSFSNRSVPDLPPLPDETESGAGVELVYRRDLRVRESWRWGLQLALSHLPLEFNSQATADGMLQVTTDSYSTFGSTVPQAPYRGSFAGPGTLLGAEPDTRSSFSTSAIISLRRELELHQFGIRLGPYLQWELGGRFSVGLGAGLSVAPTWFDFEYFDQAIPYVPSVSEVTNEGSKSTCEVLVGGYIEAMLGYQLSDHWSVQTALQYQYLGDLSATIDGRRLNLEFDAAAFLMFGVGYSF